MTTDPKKTAFIGLGVMGSPMAGHLAKAGHQVTVYNRSPEKAQAWLNQYNIDGRHSAAPTPRDAARDADLVFACVGADADVAAVTTGRDGAFQSMRPGAVFVDHTTASAACARTAGQAAREKSLMWLDAPVSGGQAGAENGVLTIMCGGAQEAYDTAFPVMQAYGRQSKLLGPDGAGQLSKMVNQVCIAGILQGLSEALHLSESAGLDSKAVIEVISGGAAQSWQMDNRGTTMVDGSFDFGFAVDWMRKDLGIVLQEARELGISLPLTALVDQFYADVQGMGGGRQDTSSLIRRFKG